MHILFMYSSYLNFFYYTSGMMLIVDPCLIQKHFILRDL